MFSDNNGIKLEINSKKIAGKSSNISKLNNKLLSNTWVEKGISGEIIKYVRVSLLGWQCGEPLGPAPQQNKHN